MIINAYSSLSAYQMQGVISFGWFDFQLTKDSFFDQGTIKIMNDSAEIGYQ